MCLALSALPALAQQEKRVAFVAGNASYRSHTPLKNAANDARDMAGKLRVLGFDVIDGSNLTQIEMISAIRRFADAAANADAALAFYSGHAVQRNGVSYMLPIDARIDGDASLEAHGVPVTALYDALAKAKPRSARLLILDACRDDPISAALQRAGGQARAGPATAAPPSGIMAAYATQTDAPAYDGTGRNGWFTAAILKRMDQPGQDVVELMAEARREVIVQTSGAQTPEIAGSLAAPFALARTETDTEVWTAITDKQDVDQLRAFIARFPRSPFAQAAQAIINSQARMADVSEQRLRQSIDRLLAQRLERFQAIRRDADEGRRFRLLEVERMAQLKAEEAKARLEQERQQREKDEQQRLAREQAEREKAEKERLAQEKVELERVARLRAEEERRVAEATRLEQLRLARDLAEREKNERERIARERQEREKIERDRLAFERAEQERLTRARVEEERRANETARVEQQRLAREQAERDKAEKDRLAAEKIELERVAKLRAEEQRKVAEAARVEQIRLAREQAEREKTERERLAIEQQERDRAEKARLAQEKIDQQRTTAAEAAMRIAALPEAIPAPSPLPTLPASPATTLPPAVAPKDSVRLLQKELKRMGCYAGNENGNYNNGTQAAIERYRSRAELPAGSKKDLSLTDADQLLAHLRGNTERLCPLECGSGQIARDGACVAARTPAQPKRRVVEEEEEDEAPAAQRRRPAPGARETVRAPVRQAPARASAPAPPRAAAPAAPRAPNITGMSF